MRTRRVVGAVAAGLAGALAVALPAAAAPSTIWQVQPTPNMQHNAVTDSAFHAVSSSSPSDAWAVGGFSDKHAVLHPLVEHWDGTAWSLVSVPQPANHQSSLAGIDDLSITNAWAVGTSTSPTATNQDERTLIEHWDGTEWSIVPSPNPATGVGDLDVLTSISSTSPSDIWAAGWTANLDENDINMLFEHYNGTTWQVVPSPVDGQFQFAFAVKAISPDDAWAVGNDGSGDPGKTLAEHWDGNSWTIVPTPFLEDGKSAQNTLTGITATGPDDVWASGYESNVNDTNFAEPYLLHWDGNGWTLVKVPNKGTEGSLLSDVTALSPTDIWAVGQSGQNNGSILSLTEQFNGKTWTVVPSPDPGSIGNLKNNSLAGVSSPSAGIVFTGGAQEIAGQCCLRTLAMETTQG